METILQTGFIKTNQEVRKKREGYVTRNLLENMKCQEIENGIICYTEHNFNCPNCDKYYDDYDEKYYKRIVKNKSYITSTKCECGIKFYITYDYTGSYQTFKK
jgi:hypothetical protein